jgi:hypothetical protein
MGATEPGDLGVAETEGVRIRPGKDYSLRDNMAI